MMLPWVLIVLISFSVIDNIHCQMPDIPIPPMPQMPGFFESRIRRSAQAPTPPAPPAPPVPPMALEPEQRFRRSATAPISSGFKQMNVGEIASTFYGIRNKREARGGRMPTTNG